MKFTSNEIRDLIRAWLLLSIAFAIVFTGFSLNYRFLISVAIAGITAGIGFVLHELAHKYTAQQYGCRAEFKAFDHMLWLAVLMSFFGFIFAAPGAVMIHGRITPQRNGLISLAGPATNLVLGILFSLLLFTIQTPLLTPIFHMGTRINLWLALFNLLPFFGLDGSKVLLWDKRVYATAVALSLLLLFALG